MDVNFNIDNGEILLISGRNGAGKSSLLRLLCGTDKPIRGEISWNKTSIFDTLTTFRSNLHYVSHKNPIKDGLTVIEHLRFWARFGSKSADNAPNAVDSAVDAAMDGFQLRALADVSIRLLSQGQRRRLALARLLCQPRKIWLLDEPSVGLDKTSVAKLEILIEDHRRDGGIVIVVTHSRLTLLKSQKLDMDGHAPALHDLSSFWETIA